MKRVLFDVNVVLDVLLDRQPHADASAAAWALAESGLAEGLLAAHAVTTIYYLIRKEKGTAGARRILSAILSVFEVAVADGDIIRDALQLPFADFEDAVTAASARQANCDYILTRDPKGFRGSPVLPLSPEAAVLLLTETSPAHPRP
jgi:predicted nucleic acid-binding protein